MREIKKEKKGEQECSVKNKIIIKKRESKSFFFFFGRERGRVSMIGGVRARRGNEESVMFGLQTKKKKGHV